MVSWIPADSIPRKDGWKRASGHRNRSLPMVMTLEKTLACLKADDGLGSATCQRIMVACQAGQVFPARQVFPAKAGFFGRQVFENSRSIFFKKM